MQAKNRSKKGKHCNNQSQKQELSLNERRDAGSGAKSKIWASVDLEVKAARVVRDSSSAVVCFFPTYRIPHYEFQKWSGMQKEEAGEGRGGLKFSLDCSGFARNE